MSYCNGSSVSNQLSTGVLTVFYGTVGEFVKLSMPLTPIVLSASGGLAHEATTFYKRLASLLSTKLGDEYSVVLGSALAFLSQCIRMHVLPLEFILGLLLQW